MSTKLGTLTLDLVAKISNFVEPIDQAEKKTKSLSQAIAENFNVSTLAVNALGAAFSGVTVGGLAAFTNQVISTGSEIKKLSQLSNASTFDFQFYAKGAETAGISMDSFAQQMKDMQDRIGDFQQTGGGPLADFFANIAPLVGVTIDQFQKLSGPDALQLFYSSLEKVGATKNDIKFYMESIISDSSLLIPLLENGGKGFEKWGQAASDAGAIMSDEMIGELALAKENMQLLNLEFEGMQVSLINGFTPVVQTVANNLDVVAVSVGTLAAAMTVKAAPAFIADTALKVSNTIATRQKAVADYEIAKSNLAATVAMVRAMGVANAQTAAMITNANAAYKQAAATRTAALASTSMIGILGGPVGLALTVATVAGSYILFRDNTDKSTISLRENNETVEQAIQKYSDLDKIKRAAQLVEEREKLEQLSDSYETANSKLISYTLNVVRNADMTSDQAQAFSSLVMDYKSGKITLEELSDALSKSTVLSNEEKNAFVKKAASVRDASNEVNKHKNLVSQMIERDKQLIKINDDVTSSIDRRGAALLKLSQKEREVYNSIGQELERESYINANVSQGFMSRDKAEYFADKRAEAGIPYSKLLTKEMYLQFKQGYKLQQQIEQREESEKKIVEEQKKRADFAEKNYSYTKSELALYQRIAKLSAENNLNEIGAQHGVPKNMLAALMAHESGGDPNAVSATGAIGYFQTTSRYRKDNKISIEDSKNLPVIAQVVAKNLAKAYEELGSWEAAIRSHNAGLEGSRQFEKNGRVNGSAARNKEVANFVPKVDKIFAALNGSSLRDSGVVGKEAVTSIKDLGEYYENAEQLKKESLERQKNVDRLYLSENERLLAEHEDAKKEIQEAYVGDTTAIEKYVSIQNKIYAEAQKLADMQFAWEVTEHRLTEEQKLRYSHNIKEQEIRASTQLTNEQKKQKLDVLKQQFDQEFAMFKLAQEKQLLEMKRNWMTAGEFASQYYAIVKQEILNTPSYSPELKQAMVKDANFNQGLEENSEREQIWGDYQSRFGEQDSPYENDLKLLQAARKEGLVIEEEYFARKAELEASAAMASTAQLGNALTSMLDKSSGAYAVALGMQKSFSIYSSLMAAKTAYAQAFADPSAMTVPQKILGAMAVAAPIASALGELMSINTSITGMAHDGIDNVPKEGTWLLDKGERVVDSRTNADLKNYLQDARSQSSSPNITINVPPGYTAHQTESNDGITIDVVDRMTAQNLADPNSQTSKAYRRQYATSWR